MEFPHRRFNPLSGEWVLVSPHRTNRPWQGSMEEVPAASLPAFDPKCYLCPGNERAGGKRNPPYTSTFVFDNDFPALLPDTAYKHFDRGGLLSAEMERGICRVGCFSPRHDLTMAHMSIESLTEVVDMWTGQYLELGSLPFIRHVQIFENRGEAMGASNPHPHCQIWANSSVPDVAAREIASQLEYERRKASCLLCDYTELEAGGERVICQNDSFVVLVPFWAYWPFETLVLCKRHVTGLDELSQAERTGLAEMLNRITAGYDNLFLSPFPYSLGLHQRPTDGAPHRSSHFHAHFYPPLLRSATIRKFTVGYEMFGGPQRDIPPEAAAAQIRSVLPKTK